MNTFLEDQLVTLELPVVDASGASYSGSWQASWTLSDVNGEEVAKGDLSGEGETMKVGIDAQYNHVESGKIKDLRSFSATLTAVQSEAVLQPVKTTYLLTSSQPLIVGQNSAVTYEMFQLIAATTPKLDQLTKASEDEAVIALSNAYKKLSKYRYRLTASFPMEHIQYVSEVAWRPRAITDDNPFTYHRFKLKDLTEKSFEQLPEDFREALALAQVYEANAILSPTDTIVDRRRKGVILETIHEVKMMFSSTTPVKEYLSTEALEVLSPWIDRSVRLTRV